MVTYGVTVGLAAWVVQVECDCCGHCHWLYMWSSSQSLSSYMLCGRANRPHYRSCPSVRLSVLYVLLTGKRKGVEILRKKTERSSGQKVGHESHYAEILSAQWQGICEFESGGPHTVSVGRLSGMYLGVGTLVTDAHPFKMNFFNEANTS